MRTATGKFLALHDHIVAKKNLRIYHQRSLIICSFSIHHFNQPKNGSCIYIQLKAKMLYIYVRNVQTINHHGSSTCSCVKLNSCQRIISLQQTPAFGLICFTWFTWHVRPRGMAGRRGENRWDYQYIHIYYIYYIYTLYVNIYIYNGIMVISSGYNGDI